MRCFLSCLVSALLTSDTDAGALRSSGIPESQNSNRNDLTSQSSPAIRVLRFEIAERQQNRNPKSPLNLLRMSSSVETQTEIALVRFAVLLEISGGCCLHENYYRGRKRHINIWHINNFSVTPVTDPPGRVPDSSRPGTRTKMFMFLGFRTQHINF